MRKLNELTTEVGKGSKNKNTRKGKSFGYQVLGFGSGGRPPRDPVAISMLIVAGGAAGGS